MSRRIKAILIIIPIAVTIVVFGTGAGLIFVQGNLEKNIESDMTAVADIADGLITAKIDLLKADVSIAAQLIRNAADREIQDV